VPTTEQFDSALTGARANADWAWHLLHEWYAPTVLQFLRSQRADHPEDLLGEVFVDVVRSLHTFSGGPDEFRSWLMRIAHNRFLDERRAHGRRPATAAMSDEQAASSAPGADEAVLARSDEQRLYRLLRVLPEDQRAAVFMRVVLEMPPAEIALVMERRVGSTKMLIQRGLKTLEGRLRDQSRDRP
jgi:RNA polymerase sigma-70 factor, ECF subfamily